MTSMDNTPDSPAKTPEGYTTQGGNFWTLITPEIWKVLHAVLQPCRPPPSANVRHKPPSRSSPSTSTVSASSARSGDTIIKEVPVYVPVQADAACTINRGFVRLHDAAAAGKLPEPARDADAAATGIALSAVAGTVAANYQTCHENAEQLRALQTWVTEMKVASEQ